MFTHTLLSKLVKVAETEKAIAIKGWKSYGRSTKSFETKVWIPKSIIKDGEIPAWFIGKKEQEWAIDDIKVIVELA